MIGYDIIPYMKNIVKKPELLSPAGNMACLEAALSAGCDAAFWDLFGIMGGAGSMDAWVNGGYARADHIHFTPEGYTVLGNLLFNALMDTYAARMGR